MQTSTVDQLQENLIDYRGRSVPKSDSGIPLITAKNIRKGFIDFSEAEFISKVDYEDWSSKGYPAINDVLITTEAPLGMVALFPQGKHAIAQRVICIRPKQDLIDSEYLMYFLLSQEGQKRLYRRSSGSTALGIKQSELRKVKIDYPPLEKQKKITEILSTWDDAIQAVDELIEKKKKLKQTVLSNTFSNYILNEEADSTVLDLLGDEGYISDGDWIESKDQDENGKVRLIQLADIGEGKFLNKSDRYMTREKAESLKCTYISGGEVLIARMPDPLGRACVFPNMKGIYVTVVDVCIIKPSSNFDPKWITYLINSPRFRNEIEKRSSGTTRTRISRKNLQKIKFFLPNKQQSEKDVAILSAIDEELLLLAKKKKCLHKQKKGLMQRLLSGKVRVN